VAGFLSLDFVYTPSTDVKRDATYFTDVLGGRLVFAVEGMGARVAAIELSSGSPLILLADHLEGEAPVLVFRVKDLRSELNRLEKQGWKRGTTLEIPHGPCCSFRAPGGQRLALYQLTRPEVGGHFEGRRDF
jgi:hypothetical protein